MPTETLLADALLANSGWSGSPVIGTINEDPDTPAGTWLVASSNNVATSARVSFPTPTGTPTGVQTFKAFARKNAASGTGTPTGRIDLYEDGALKATGTNVNLAAGGTLITQTFDLAATPLTDTTGAGVEAVFVGTPSGGSPSVRASADLDCINWDTVNYSTADTAGPSAPVLTGTTGSASGTVDLSWTASTDPSGINRYEIWFNDTNTWIGQVLSGVLAYTVTGVIPGSSRTYRVVAYDNSSNQNATNSNIVTVVAAGGGSTLTQAVSDAVSAADGASPALTTGGGVSPAAFPSRLSTSGRNIVDENGYIVGGPGAPMRGFNLHNVPWAQTNLNDIAALDVRAFPARFTRVTILWPDIQPTNGTSVSSSYIANLDTTVARLQAAGIYCMFELHLNTGNIPTWAQAGLDETDRFCKAGANNGQFVTEYLAKRYGDPTDPLGAGKYTKAVVGFGLNEPPVNGTTMNSAAGSVPYLEDHQGRVFGWMRTYAPNWIGFMAWAYAQSTPIYEGPGEDTSKTDANPAHACYVNAVIDVHDYASRVDTESAADTGRQFNGSVWSIGNGGHLRGPGDDLTYTSTATHRAQHANYFAPYKKWCTDNNKPLMLGEWGWSQTTSQYASGGAGQTALGEQEFIDDKQIAWSNAGTSIELYWNYDVTTNTSINPWAAKPGGTWRLSVSDWMAAANTSGGGGSSSTYRTAVLADSPTAFLRLGEASGTVAADETGAHPGTYVNTPTLGVTGATAGDTAVSFDGASIEHVLIDTLGTLGQNIITSSWEFWIGTTTTAQGALYGVFNTGTTLAVMVQLNRSAADAVSNGKTRIYFRGTDGLQLSAEISTNLYDGALHHVVIVMTSSTTIKVRVDKVDQAVTYGLQQAITSTASFGFPLALAARNLRGVVDLPSTVVLDEFAVYPVRLSDAQIDAHYDARNITSVSSLQRSVADTTAVSDGASFGAGEGVGDTLSLADLQTSARAFNAAAGDALSLVDAAITAAGKGASPADTLALVDSATIRASVLRALADALGLTDGLALLAALGIGDASSLSDAASTASGKGASPADALTVADSALSQANVSQALSDSLGLADDQSRLAVIGVGDALALVDSAFTGGAREANVSDALTLADSALLSWTRAVLNSDAVVLTDAASLAGNWNALLTDSVTPADALVLARGIERTLADTGSVADSTLLARAVVADLADTLGVTDATARGIAATLPDVLVLTDARLSAFTKGVADALVLVDAVSPSLGVLGTYTHHTPPLRGVYGNSTGGVILAVIANGNVTMISAKGIVTTTDDEVVGAL